MASDLAFSLYWWSHFHDKLEEHEQMLLSPCCHMHSLMCNTLTISDVHQARGLSRVHLTAVCPEDSVALK